MIVFEEHHLSLSRVCNIILQDLGENKKIQIAWQHRITRPPFLEWNLVMGFFDGASQCEGSKCGAGVILKFPELGFYSLKLNCGPRTNNRGELLALWSILFFAHFKEIKILQMVGDSKVIVDWFSFKNNLQVSNLQHWMSKIRQLSGKFHDLKTQHIYRDYNKEVDQLSKKALQLEEVVLFYAKGIGIHT
jgi:ribonuclease HI